MQVFEISRIFISHYSRKCKCDKFDSLCHDYAHTSNPMVFCEHSRWNQVLMYFTARMEDHNRINEGGMCKCYGKEGWSYWKWVESFLKNLKCS
jgi:hypothetical protein